jgi:hypothetical protein
MSKLGAGFWMDLLELNLCKIESDDRRKWAGWTRLARQINISIHNVWDLKMVDMF